MHNNNVSKWLDVILNSIDKFIHIETHDGVVREGKLTGIRTRQIVVNGNELDYIEGVELNGDPSDNIEFCLIKAIDID